MAKKKKSQQIDYSLIEEEEFFVEINVCDNPTLKLSPFAFGTLFANCRYCYDVSETKFKNDLYPKIEQKIKSVDGERFIVQDIRFRKDTFKNGQNVTKIIYDISKI